MPSEALVECRADYAVGTFIFMLRWFVQWKRAGFRSWSWGEAMSICAWFFFTVLYAELEVIGNERHITGELGCKSADTFCSCSRGSNWAHRQAKRGPSGGSSRLFSRGREMDVFVLLRPHLHDLELKRVPCVPLPGLDVSLSPYLSSYS